MHCLRWLLRVELVLLAAAASACATTTPGPTQTSPTLTFEEHSLRIPLTVQANGSVSLAESPPLIGRIDLSPILEVEGIRAGVATTTVVQLMVHYGRFYLVGDGFRSVWEITPQPGTAVASYRRIAIALDGGAKPESGARPESPAKPVREVRLSRFGSSGSSCLRLDRANGPTVFITPKGDVAGACP